MKIFFALLGFALLAPMTAQAGPAHDSFTKARAIETAPYEGSFTTTGSTVERGEPSPSCGKSVATTWFRLAVSDELPLGISTFDSNFDTIVAVYSGTKITRLTEVACNDNAGTRKQSMLAWDAKPRNMYLIQVGTPKGRGGKLRLKMYLAAHRERDAGQAFNISSPFSVVAVPNFKGAEWSADLDASYCLNSLCIPLLNVGADGHRNTDGQGTANACAKVSDRFSTCP